MTIGTLSRELVAGNQGAKQIVPSHSISWHEKGL